MDELIKDFLIETKEGLEILDSDLIELERNPNNKETISNLFRIMNNIKGTCGFLGLERLWNITHAGESLLYKVQEGKTPVTTEIISIILDTVDHIKSLIGYLEENGSEQIGNDSKLISKIKSFAKNINEPEVAMAATDNNDEEKSVISGDSAYLQRLFDATPCLIDMGGINFIEQKKLSPNKTPIHTNIIEDEDTQKSSFVIFQAVDATPKVVPLELLFRLENIDASKIEYTHGTPVIQYRGNLMRLISIDPKYKFPHEGEQELLVFNDGKSYMGTAVDKIIDIVKAPVKKKISRGVDGILGSLIIDGKTYDIIDVSYYFKKAFNNVTLEKAQNNHKLLKMVLLVDDSPFFRKFIPPELKKAGFAVTVTSNGKDALSKLESANKYAALVTDLAMPLMTGHELAKLCKQKDNLKNLPIIALSSDRDGMEYLNAGTFDNIDAFVSKTNHIELINILNNMIQQKENVQ